MGMGKIPMNMSSLPPAFHQFIGQPPVSPNDAPLLNLTSMKHIQQTPTYS